MKLNIFKLTAMLLISSSLFSCSDESIYNLDEQKKENSTKISLNQALKRVDKVMKRLDGGKTRARYVKSVEIIKKGELTRSSSENNDMYYVVNYADDNGFAVVGADKRIEGVYAISDNGCLDMKDTLYNGGLNIFFRSLDNMAEVLTGDGTVAPPDSLIIPKPDPNEYEDLSEVRGPYLTDSVSRWDQFEPFNKYCPWITTDYNVQYRPAAGCAAVATAQMMSFYEHPSDYGTSQYITFFNWENMKHDNSDNGIPSILYELGTPENLNITYGHYESSTDYYKYYKQTFKNFGYNEPGDFKTFNSDDIRSCIKGGDPVLLRGVHKQLNEGHVWIIDGYYFCWEKSPAYVDGYGGEGLMFHMIWGRGGDANGYFKYGTSLVPCFTHNTSLDDFKTQLWEVNYGDIKYCGSIRPKN